MTSDERINQRVVKITWGWLSLALPAVAVLLAAGLLWLPGSGSARAQAGDTDGDGFSDAAETFMGTDPLDACAANTTPNNEGLPDAWPYDFNDDRFAGLADLLGFIAKVGTVGNPRWDLNQDGRVSLIDMVKYIPVFATSCVP